MAELVKWIQNEQLISAVLVSGIAQFQLVHIHPFLDGNGRAARLLSTLCLYRFGYDFKKLFTISEYYDRNRQDYYNAIQSVRNNNMDMTCWLEYFCKALETQMREIQLKGSRAIKLDVLAVEHKLSQRQKQALEHFIERGGEFSINDYERLCPAINRRTLQRDLSDLTSKGLIIQSGAKKTTLYRLNIIEWY
ncbi:MAG: Fic family protein [Waddliaceae bacterium]